MMTWTRLLAVAFCVLLTVIGIVLSGTGMHAEDQSQKSAVQIVKPWARATPGGVTVGAAYVEIKTGLPEGDRLISAASPRAGRVEIHTHIMEGGVMKMRKVEGLDITKDKPRVLAPGGDHIMLFELNGPLKKGEKLPLTFTFKKAGKISVEAEVAAIGAPGPNAHAASGSKGDHSHHRGSAVGDEDDRGSGAGGE